MNRIMTPEELIEYVNKISNPKLADNNKYVSANNLDGYNFLYEAKDNIKNYLDINVDDKLSSMELVEVDGHYILPEFVEKYKISLDYCEAQKIKENHILETEKKYEEAEKRVDELRNCKDFDELSKKLDEFEKTSNYETYISNISEPNKAETVVENSNEPIIEEPKNHNDFDDVYTPWWEEIEKNINKPVEQTEEQESTEKTDKEEIPIIENENNQMVFKDFSKETMKPQEEVKPIAKPVIEPNVEISKEKPVIESQGVSSIEWLSEDVNKPLLEEKNKHLYSEEKSNIVSENKPHKPIQIPMPAINIPVEKFEKEPETILEEKTPKENVFNKIKVKTRKVYSWASDVKRKATAIKGLIVANIAGERTNEFKSFCDEIGDIVEYASSNGVDAGREELQKLNQKIIAAQGTITPVEYSLLLKELSKVNQKITSNAILKRI